MILLIYGLFTRTAISIIFVLFAGLILGFVRGSQYNDSINKINKYIGKNLTIEGTVDDEVVIDGNNYDNFYLKDISINRESFETSIKTSINSREQIERGDRLILEAKITRYFTNKIFIEGIILNKIERNDLLTYPQRISKLFSDNIRSVIDEPASSLGLGFLIGQKNGIQTDILDVMKIAGLTHVIVASGYNLTILIRACRRIFTKVSKYAALMSSLFLVLIFVSIAGMGPSTFRASIVVVLSLLAWYYGRRFNPLILITIAAASTVLINPSYILGDVGWQLSFAAFFGVMILAPLIRGYFFGSEKVGFVSQLLTETLSAIILTIPIISATFGNISIIAVIANLLLLPIVPASMLLVLLSGVMTAIVGPLGHLLGFTSQFIIDIFINVATYFSAINWAQISFQMNLYLVIAYYTVVLFLIAYLYYRTRIDLKKVNIIE
jgi:competence protein ComEC